MEKNAIAQAAENYSTTPRTILGNLTNRVAADTQSGVGEMRNTKTLQQAIQHQGLHCLHQLKHQL